MSIVLFTDSKIMRTFPWKIRVTWDMTHFYNDKDGFELWMTFPQPCFVLFKAYDCLRQNDSDINIFCCPWYFCHWSVLVSSQYYILMYQRHCLHLSISMSQISWSEYKLLHSHHLPQTLDKIRKVGIIWKC